MVFAWICAGLFCGIFVWALSLALSHDFQSAHDMVSTIVRYGRPADMPFVCSSWLHHFKHGSSYGRHIKYALFFEQQRKVVEALLARSKLVVITPEDDDDLILGYCVYSPEAVHYLFVKEPFRRMGLGTKLLPSVPFFTHWTDDCAWATKKFPQTFNPYLAYEAKK